jgi:cobyric acid synthase
LSLIPACTTLTPEKRTRAVRATTAGGVMFGGYEIHVGVTSTDAASAIVPFAMLDDGTMDGFQRDGVIGTYLHGSFENPDVCSEILGITMPATADKAVHYQQLALWFEQHGRHLDRLGFD